MKTLWTLLAYVRSDEIDVVGQLGQDHLLASVDSESNWYWRPSAYGGWGYDCTARDIDDNCIWTWSHGDQKTWNEWRTIEQLDNVEQDENRNLWIKSLGLKDNRIYGLISPMSGKVLRSYVVKVGEAPSFPSEIKCITLIESLKMECTWEIDERQLLPWARTESSLNYQRAELSQVNEDQLSFNETDKLLPCPSGPCSSRSHGCCTFALRPSDIDRKKVITFRLEVISRNLFGERRMQRGNSQIIHVSPSQLIKPLAPVITNVTAPNLYDGSKLKVSIEDQNLTQSWVEPVYNYRAEYRLRGSTSWQSTALTTGDELTLSKLLPFKEYEIRVTRMPVFSGFWSLPSQVVTAFTQPIEPTALLQPKFTVSEDKKVQFFWSVYHQRNAPGTAIRLQVLGKDCDEEDMPKQRLYDEKLNVTTTEVDISEIPSSVQCLEAAFSVVNDKGEKRSPLIFIDLRRGDLTVPAIVAETNEFGQLIIDLADREHIGNFGLDREMAILLCFTREGDLKGEPETCHVQHVTARQFPIESKATVTPCYNYNVYLQVEHQGMKLRSKPTQIKQSDTFQIKTGTIGSVSDKSSQSTPALEVIYQIEQPVHNLYDMHPVVSYRNKLNDFVYRKKVDPVKTRVTLNETVGDHLVGGGDVEVWLSLCCDEDSSSCHAHTDAKRLNLQPGLPGSVSDMAMIWRKEESAYKLQWNNPLKTNAPITGYHVIVQYPDIRFSKYPLQNSEKTYYLNLQSSNELLLEDVCFTMFDQVNVTVAAYTLVGEKLTLGKPIDYQFSCSDLMVVGFSIGILSAIGLLIGIVDNKFEINVSGFSFFVHKKQKSKIFFFCFFFFK